MTRSQLEQRAAGYEAAADTVESYLKTGRTPWQAALELRRRAKKMREEAETKRK